MTQATSPTIRREVDSQHAAAIRALNDRLRCECIGGQRMVTRGIAALAKDTVARIVQAVGTYTDFDQGNDPYNEHDFGSLLVEDRHVLWKIDYYDKNRRYASPDPSDPAVTRRVLTIMLAEEY